MANCSHNWVWDSETRTSVTHRCTKCGATNTQSKHHRSEHVGRFYAAAFLAVFALAVVLTIWAGGAA